MMLPPGVNSQLSDKDPREKIKIYRTCGLRSAIEVADLIEQGKWNEGAVGNREKHLLNWIRREWTES